MDHRQSTTLDVESALRPKRTIRYWRACFPYLILGVVVMVFIAFTNGRPQPVMNESPQRLPSLDEESIKQLLGGPWLIREVWNGTQCVFSKQQEIARFDGVDYSQLNTGMSWWSARIEKGTLQIVSQRETRNRKSPELWTSGEWRTEMVFVVRFDPEGLGTVDALPIDWNEEIEPIRKRIDAGESRKGLYKLNGREMRVYIPADTGPRRTSIPEKLTPGDLLFAVCRYEENHRGGLFFPRDLPEKFDGKIQSLNADGTVDYISFDGHRMVMRVEQLPQPVKTPIAKAVDPPPTDKTITFCHTNGWIVQTEPGPPPVIPPIPRNIPPLQRLKNLFK